MTRFAFSRATALLFTLLLAHPAAAADSRVGIAATVNDEVITLSDVDNRAQLYLGGRPDKPTAQQRVTLQKEVLNKLIDEKLQLQEAKNLSIDVADEQIAQGFAEIARQNGTSPEEFRDRLQRAGVNTDTLRDQIRAEIAWGQVVRRRLRPQVNVSEQEIDTAMQQRAGRANEPQYHVAEIFLASDEGNDSAIAAEAAAIYQALLKGARFSDIARARSQSPGANNGGDIGWLAESQLAPELQPVVRQLQPGMASTPIKVENGYMLVFLRDKKADAQTAFTAPAAAMPLPVGEPILQMKQLTIPATPDEPKPVIAAKFARAQALSETAKDCASLDTAATEFGTKTAAGPQKLSTLPAPIAAVMRDLADNVLSPPVRTTNGISVFMICSRETPPAPVQAMAAPVAAPAMGPDTGGIPAPGTSAEETVREAIASEIGSDRLVQMQERYLRDLRATAFIERRL